LLAVCACYRGTGPCVEGPERLELTLATISIHIVTTLGPLTQDRSKAILGIWETGSSRRDFIRHTLFGAGIGGLLSIAVKS